MKKYKTLIGVEIHAEIDTKTKAFCGCRNEFGALPNTLVCPVCLGLAGAVPSVNRKAIEKVIKAGILLGSEIANTTMFERKNFFYPDMPKGYQLVQYTMPLCEGGQVELSTGRVVNINRIHLEEDSGKLNHNDEFDQTYIDFNRSGVPVVEIVADPVQIDSDEIIEYISMIKRTLMYGEISCCMVERGGFRFDINISVCEIDSKTLGTRVELKNLTSFKQLKNAIEYERERHISILETGGVVKQETRVWSEDMGKTYIVRAKENINDYRHLADPDIKLIKISSEDIAKIKDTIPETYQSKVNRYRRLKLSESQIELLTSEKFICDYFDEVIKHRVDPHKVLSWISGEMLHAFKLHNRTGFDNLISPEDLVTIINLEKDGEISNTNAKVLFNEVVATGKSAEVLSKELGIVGKVSDSEIDSVVDAIIEGNIDIIGDFRENPANVMNYFVGKVKTMTGGRANAETIQNRTIDKINKN